MSERIKNVLISILISLSMTSNFISPIYAQEEVDEEVIVENEEIDETTEEITEDEIIEEEIVEEVTEEESIEEIEEEITEEDCDAIYKDYTYDVTPSGAIQLINYTGSDSKLEIPSTIDGKPVKYIGLQVFAGKTNIQEVVFPNTIEDIGYMAFKGCTGLQSVSFPDSVKKIGSEAFWGCSSLQTITWGENIESIGSEAFSGCNLIEIEIPETITSIGYGAFDDNKNLEKIYYYPAYIESIEGGLGCFKNCGQNIFGFELIIGDEVQKLPDNFFRSKYGEDYATFPKLVKVTGGANLIEIGSYAFANCRVLDKTFEIPKSVRTIDSYAFFDSNAIDKIVFPENIQTIGSNAFNSCTSLINLTFEGAAPTIDENAFASLFSISIYYPESQSITWEPMKISNYGASYVEWISDLRANMSGNDVGTTQIVSSPDWPSNYPKNCTFDDTKQHISYPGASSIKIVFDVTSETETKYDYIRIVKADNTEQILTGSAFAFDPVIIQGDSFDIGFVSDGSAEKKGFEAKIYPIYNSEITVTSPNWPNEYPNGVTMVKELRFDGAKKIYIKFDPTSSLEGHGSVAYDYVRLIDENDKTVYEFTGDINTEFYYTGSYLKIYFKSDGSVAKKGFSLTASPNYNEGLQQSNQVAGYTLSLSGDIGVNFYMNLTEEAQKVDSGTYMEFSMPGKSVKKVELKDAKIIKTGVNKYYAFPYHVSAKDMTQTITAKLYSQGQLRDIYTYTVEEYANYVISHNNVFDTKVVDIARAMLMYGKTAQQYFDYHTDQLPSYNQSAYTPDLSRYEYLLNTTGNIKFKGARLVLKQKPGIKLYFTGVSSTTKFYVDRQEVQKYKEGDMYYILISDIDQMSRMFDIDSDDFFLRYGIFSYGYQALSLDGRQDLKNLISAMHNYNSSFWAVG